MPAPIDNFLVRDEHATEGPGIGHPVHPATGLASFGRLLCLGQAALANLFAQDDIRSLDHRATGLALGLAAKGSPATTARTLPPCADPRVGPKLASELLELAGLAIPPTQVSLFAVGHAAVAQAVAWALPELQAGRLRRCLVGGIDSLLDPHTLAALQQADRLKSPLRPDGLQPGEAAAFVLLERCDEARRRRATPMAQVVAAAVAHESDRYAAERSSSGAGLAQAARSVLARIEPAEVGGSFLVSDHSGETFRARELGTLLVRLSVDQRGLADASPQLPTTSFGDTGAAGGAVGLCTTATALFRGYAPGATSAIVLSSSDGPERGAILLRAIS